LKTQPNRVFWLLNICNYLDSNNISVEDDHPCFSLLMYLADAACIRDKLPDASSNSDDLKDPVDELGHGTIEDILTAASLAQSMKEEIFGFVDDALISDSEEYCEEDDEAVSSIEEAHTKDCEMIRLEPGDDASASTDESNDNGLCQQNAPDILDVEERVEALESIFLEHNDEAVGNHISPVKNLSGARITPEAEGVFLDNRSPNVALVGDPAAPEITIFREDMSQDTPTDEGPRFPLSSVSGFPYAAEYIVGSSPSKRIRPSILPEENMARENVFPGVRID
jgi:hypothetical protein